MKILRLSILVLFLLNSCLENSEKIKKLKQERDSIIQVQEGVQKELRELRIKITPPNLNRYGVDTTVWICTLESNGDLLLESMLPDGIIFYIDSIDVLTTK